MVKEWSIDEIRSTTGSITEAGIGAIKDIEGEPYDNWEEIPFGEIIKQPAAKFVKTKQRWCERFVAESYGKNKRIEKASESPAFQIIKKVINSNSPKYFDTKDIINWTEATNKTDGSIQNKLLNVMVCMGLLQNKHIKFKDKNGKERFKYVYICLKEPKKCPHLINGKCDFDWKEGAVTDYFPEEYKEINDLV